MTHRLDKAEYAVKKVYAKFSKERVLVKILREVTLLAKVRPDIMFVQCLGSAFGCVSNARSHITKLNVVRIQVASWRFKSQKLKKLQRTLKILHFYPFIWKLKIPEL